MPPNDDSLPGGKVQNVLGLVGHEVGGGARVAAAFCHDPLYAAGVADKLPQGVLALLGIWIMGREARIAGEELFIQAP